MVNRQLKKLGVLVALVLNKKQNKFLLRVASGATDSSIRGLPCWLCLLRSSLVMNAEVAPDYLQDWEESTCDHKE